MASMLRPGLCARQSDDRSAEWTFPRSGSLVVSSGVGEASYAALAIARPTSWRDAPSVSRDLTSRSTETEASAASILATRDWLEPNR